MFGSDCALMTLKASCFEILSFIATSCVRICNENTLTLLQKSFPLTSGTIICYQEWEEIYSLNQTLIPGDSRVFPVPMMQCLCSKINAI